MPHKFLHIDLGADFTLDFRIHDSAVADLWLERMALRDPYPIDHPDRFYGFDSPEQEAARAEAMVRGCVDTINAYQPIIEKPFTSVHDQDCLNYLHSVFERYHGLLDQQKTRWWLRAPAKVKRALAELNLAVHRCESAGRAPKPRLVCTWFGVPKGPTLPESVMQQCGTVDPPFGSVCLNYAEIGKTLMELTLDNDSYISDDAFKPFAHYAPDFVVKFFELDPQELSTLLSDMRHYHQQHRDFFASLGLDNFDHVKLLPLQFPVAQLIETMPRLQLINAVQQRQYVTKVYIDETMHHSNS